MSKVTTGATGPNVSSVHDGEVRGHVCEDGGAVEQALVGAADRQPGPTLDRPADDAIDARQLPLVDDRAEVDILAIRVPQPQPPGLLHQCVHVVARDAPVDDVPSGGEAHLALELERGIGPGRGGRVEVGVIEHDERVVAAELQ